MPIKYNKESNIITKGNTPLMSVMSSEGVVAGLNLGTNVVLSWEAKPENYKSISIKIIRDNNLIKTIDVKEAGQVYTMANTKVEITVLYISKYWDSTITTTINGTQNRNDESGTRTVTFILTKDCNIEFSNVVQASKKYIIKTIFSKGIEELSDNWHLDVKIKITIKRGTDNPFAQEEAFEFILSNNNWYTITEDSYLFYNDIIECDIEDERIESYTVRINNGTDSKYIFIDVVPIEVDELYIEVDDFCHVIERIELLENNTTSNIIANATLVSEPEFITTHIDSNAYFKANVKVRIGECFNLLPYSNHRQWQYTGEPTVYIESCYNNIGLGVATMDHHIRFAVNVNPISGSNLLSEDIIDKVYISEIDSDGTNIKSYQVINDEPLFMMDTKTYFAASYTNRTSGLSTVIEFSRRKRNIKWAPNNPNIVYPNVTYKLNVNNKITSEITINKCSGYSTRSVKYLDVYGDVDSRRGFEQQFFDCGPAQASLIYSAGSPVGERTKILDFNMKIFGISSGSVSGRIANQYSYSDIVSGDGNFRITELKYYYHIFYKKNILSTQDYGSYVGNIQLKDSYADGEKIADIIIYSPGSATKTLFEATLYYKEGDGCGTIDATVHKYLKPVNVSSGEYAMAATAVTTGHIYLSVKMEI